METCEISFLNTHYELRKQQSQPHNKQTYAETYKKGTSVLWQSKSHGKITGQCYRFK